MFKVICDAELELIGTVWSGALLSVALRSAEEAGCRVLPGWGWMPAEDEIRATCTLVIDPMIDPVSAVDDFTEVA